MTLRQAHSLLKKAVGPHTYFITREIARYATKIRGSVCFETGSLWRVSVFFATPDAKPGEALLDSCVSDSAASLETALKGALRKRDEFLENHTLIEEECLAELESDRQRLEIQHGERLPSGTRI